MTVYRNSGVAGLVLVLIASTGAHGQNQPSAPTAASNSPQLLSADDQSPEPTASPPAEFKPGILGSPAQSGVTRTELGIVDGAPVGTLDDNNGGLGQGMWTGSQRSDIEELLAKVPLVSADVFVRALARRVVLTISDSPVGTAKRALATIRIEKLLQAGMINEAGSIAGALQLNGDGDYARVQADALLYAGSDSEICSDLTSNRLTSADLFWLQLRTWCFSAAGDTASSELTRSVIDARGETDTALDMLMADVLSGRSLPPGELARPNALHIYLLRKAGLVVTNSIAAKLGTSANVLAARDTRNSPVDRLAAATRISQTGALAPAEMLDILNGQDISPDRLAQASDIAPTLAFLPAQSLLRRAAALETRPGAKAKLLTAALSAGGHPDRLVLSAALNAAVAASIKPDPSLTAERSIIARALVLTGRYELAAAWYAKPGDDSDTHTFQILLDIAAPNAARDADAQAAMNWFAATTVAQQSPTAAAALALGLSDVLGRAMQPDLKTLATAWEGVRFESSDRRPSADDMSKLEEAAKQTGRKGEVALRILNIVGGNGPYELAPDVVIECVRILQQSGLSEEARQLAIEALATVGQ